MATQFDSDTFENDYVLEILRHFVIELLKTDKPREQIFDKYAVELTAFMNGRIIQVVRNVTPNARATLEEMGFLRARSVPEQCTLVAVHTGDAWHLAVEDCNGDEIAVLGWPNSWPETMVTAELKAAGFEVV